MTDIYLEDSYVKDIHTVVKNRQKIKKKAAISLEENIFYPGGGGQPPDKGMVYLENYPETHILRILKMSGEIILSLPLPLEAVSIGQSVRLQIDWDHRYKLMRCHTAAHVVMATVRRNIENYRPAGIEIESDGYLVTVGFDGSWANTRIGTERIIEISNEKILENLSTKVIIYDSIEDAINDNSNIFRGDSSFVGNVRIVIIEGWDANPCGGTHVKHLSEIGPIKYESFEDQCIRFSLEK